MNGIIRIAEVSYVRVSREREGRILQNHTVLDGDNLNPQSFEFYPTASPAHVRVTPDRVLISEGSCQSIETKRYRQVFGPWFNRSVMDHENGDLIELSEVDYLRMGNYLRGRALGEELVVRKGKAIDVKIGFIGFRIWTRISSSRQQ